MEFDILISVFDDITADIHDAETQEDCEKLLMKTDLYITTTYSAKRLGKLTYKQFKQLEALGDMTERKIHLRKLEIIYEELYA